MVSLNLLNSNNKYFCFEECCYKKTFRGIDSLEGEYILKKNFDGEVYSLCNSNCIYTRKGDEDSDNEYCFGNKDIPGVSVVDQCEPFNAEEEVNNMISDVENFIKENEDLEEVVELKAILEVFVETR